MSLTVDEFTAITTSGVWNWGSQTTAFVECYGGGGRGRDGNGTVGGAGGGGGAYACTTLSKGSESSLTIAVGKGGTNTFPNGDPSSVTQGTTVVCQAAGGKQSTGTGTAGIGGLISTSIGDEPHAGGDGPIPNHFSATSGGTGGGGSGNVGGDGFGGGHNTDSGPVDGAIGGTAGRSPGVVGNARAGMNGGKGGDGLGAGSHDGDAPAGFGGGGGGGGAFDGVGAIGSRGKVRITSPAPNPRGPGHGPSCCCPVICTVSDTFALPSVVQVTLSAAAWTTDDGKPDDTSGTDADVSLDVLTDCGGDVPFTTITLPGVTHHALYTSGLATLLDGLSLRFRVDPTQVSTGGGCCDAVYYLESSASLCGADYDHTETIGTMPIPGNSVTCRDIGQASSDTDCYPLTCAMSVEPGPVLLGTVDTGDDTYLEISVCPDKSFTLTLHFQLRGAMIYTQTGDCESPGTQCFDGYVLSSFGTGGSVGLTATGTLTALTWGDLISHTLTGGGPASFISISTGLTMLPGFTSCIYTVTGIAGCVLPNGLHLCGASGYTLSQPDEYTYTAGCGPITATIE